MELINYARRFLMFIAMAAVLSFGMSGAGAAATGPFIARQPVINELRVDTVGIFDNDERGAASNVVLDFYVGSGALITSLKWDIDLTSYPGSYLSEMKLTFSDTAGNGVTFTPASGDDFDGTKHYAGFQDLGALGQIFAAGADGMLRLEFHDGYKDLAFDEPEGVWNAGTLTFGIAPVPEPSALVMLLAGLLLVSSATRRFRT